MLNVLTRRQAMRWSRPASPSPSWPACRGGWPAPCWRWRLIGMSPSFSWSLLYLFSCCLNSCSCSGLTWWRSCWAGWKMSRQIRGSLRWQDSIITYIFTWTRRTFPGDCCKLPGDLGNAPTRGRHSSPQNPGELENLKTGGQGAFSGGGGGAPLWQADAAEGSWALQGHQAHLQWPKHNPGNFHFPFALNSKRYFWFKSK